MRHPVSLLAVIALFAVGGVIVALAVARGAAERVERGHRRRQGRAPTPEGTKVVSVQRASAHAYDPLGDDEEHSDEASRTVDRDDGTAWTHRALQRRHRGRGQGRRRHLHRRQAQGRGRRSCRSRRPSPAGRRRSTPPRPARCPKTVPEGWTKVGGGTVNSKDKRFKLDTGGVAYRYYLVWITKLADGRRARRDLRDPAVPGSRRLGPKGPDPLERDGALGSKRSSARASSRSQRSGNGTPAASQSFGKTLVFGEAGHRVELVDEHALAVLDEEVDPREAGAADAHERVAGEPADLLEHRVAAAGRARRAPCRRRCTWPRSRTSRSR